MLNKTDVTLANAQELLINIMKKCNDEQGVVVAPEELAQDAAAALNAKINQGALNNA